MTFGARLAEVTEAVHDFTYTHAQTACDPDPLENAASPIRIREARILTVCKRDRLGHDLPDDLGANADVAVAEHLGSVGEAGPVCDRDCGARSVGSRLRTAALSHENSRAERHRSAVSGDDPHSRVEHHSVPDGAGARRVALDDDARVKRGPTRESHVSRDHDGKHVMGDDAALTKVVDLVRREKSMLDASRSDPCKQP